MIIPLAILSWVMILGALCGVSLARETRTFRYCQPCDAWFPTTTVHVHTTEEN